MSDSASSITFPVGIAWQIPRRPPHGVWLGRRSAQRRWNGPSARDRPRLRRTSESAGAEVFRPSQKRYSWTTRSALARPPDPGNGLRGPVRPAGLDRTRARCLVAAEGGTTSRQTFHPGAAGFSLASVIQKALTNAREACLPDTVERVGAQPSLAGNPRRRKS